MSVFISHLVFATVATITNVSHVQFDTQATTTDVRVSHVQLDTQVSTQIPPIVPVKPSYGGGYFPRETAPPPKKKRVEVKDEKLLAQLRAEDEIILQIIINAVTKELI